MPDSNPVFNDFFCPVCGARVSLQRRAHQFRCPNCNRQDSIFQTSGPVSSPSPRAKRVRRFPISPPSTPQISPKGQSQLSQTVLLPAWLCNPSAVSAAPQAPEITPHRSKFLWVFPPLAIAALLITGLQLRGHELIFQRGLNRLFSDPSLSSEEVAKILPEDAFRQGVNAAMEAATLTQSAQTQAQWQTVTSGWSEAIALMELVPPDSADRPVAEQKAIEYQSNRSYAEQQATQIAYAPPPPPPFLPMPVTNPPLPPPPPPTLAASTPPQPEERFRYAVNQAMSAASLTQWAQTQEEWYQVAQEWTDAIALMKAVPSDSHHYSTAQQKAQEYQTNLRYAQQQISQLAP
jgi:hypothetical protein